MSTPLPRISTLIAETWSAFFKNWETMLKTSVWLIPAIILIGSLSIAKTIPTIYTPIFFVFYAIGVFLSLWVTIRLYRTALAIESGNTLKDTMKSDITFFLPVIILSMLGGIATGVGFMALLIPGIYIAIRLAFVEMIVIDERIQAKGAVPFFVTPFAVLIVASFAYVITPNKFIGIATIGIAIAYVIYGLYKLYTLNKEALLKSWLLTKDRFWPIFNRQVVGIIIFALIVAIVANIALWIVEMVSGMDLSVAENEQKSLSVLFTSGAISGLIQAALVPAVYFYEVKLFRALQKTR